MKPEYQQPILRHIEVPQIINGELFELRRRAIKTSMISTRGLDDYADYLGFKPEDLVGKVILDVGSGPAIFAEEAEAIGAEVVSLDPQPGTQSESMSDEERKQLLERISVGKIIPGIAQELPFADESFDMVTAMMSVPNYLPSIESEKQLALLEMARVLKPRGEARICPVLSVPGTNISITEKEIKLLERKACSVRFERATDVDDVVKKCPPFKALGSLMIGLDRLIIEKAQ